MNIASAHNSESAGMERWNYQPAGDLDKSLAERLRCFPREPDITVYSLRLACAMTVRAWLRLYHRLEIQGVEHLPKSASFVMVANHSSHLDTLCLLSALPLQKVHRAFAAAAQDYFFVDVPRLAIAAIAVNALPFGRHAQVRQSLELCRHLLANPGNVLVLFPEGTRTTTGQLAGFKPGVGLLAAGSELPVVPCFLQGAFAAWPKGRALPLPRKLKLRIGRPLTFAGLPNDRAGAEEVCVRLRNAVQDLSYECH